jgi:Family of unknown function (DUF6196)
MISISHETPQQTADRLLHVMRNADFRVLPGVWSFEEFQISEFEEKCSPAAVALVRDETVWSQLVPAHDETREIFVLFSFHFPDNSDNSGFVGWLATLIKCRFGSGVFVTCGSNINRGGIFDYWGIPVSIAQLVIDYIKNLTNDLASLNL